MTRPRSRIGSELLLVGLVLCCVAATWFLVVSMHQHAGHRRRSVVASALPVAAPPKPAGAAPVLIAAPPPEPEPEPAPPTPVEDPTRLIVARIGAEEAEQRIAAMAADRRAEGLEHARQTALDESARWRRREQIIKSQVDALSDRARTMERAADELAMERDVLMQERDATKAALEKASHRSSYAVLPNRAPNGTWRRPIVIECRNGSVTLQPNGRSFNLLELSSLMGTRSSPIVLAVVRELVRIQGRGGPDGAPAVPYIFFVVRPDGIRPYYEARARLEPLGIAFGYELVDQNLEVDFPDLDHPGEWDGTAPLPPFAVAALENKASAVGHGGGGDSQNPDDFRWPTTPPGGGVGAGDLGEGPGRRGAGLPGGDAQGLPPFGSGGGFDPRVASGGGDGNGDGPSGSPGESLADQRRALDYTPGFGPTADMLPPGLGAGGSGGNAQPGSSAGRTPGMLPPSSGGGRGFGGSNMSTGALAGARGASSFGDGDNGVGAGAGPGPPISQRSDDASMLGGFAGAQQPPSGGLPYRSQGLKPGEPGAPPEDGSVPAGSGFAGTGSAGSGSQGSDSPGSGGHGGANPGSATAGGAPGGLAAAGGLSSLLGSSGGSGNIGAGSGTMATARASGSSSSAAAGSGQPSADGMPAEESLVPPTPGPLRIEVPMEIVIACRPSGVVIHPGGYQLTNRTLKGKDPMLAKSLRSIVRIRQQVDPMIRPRPSIRFLVEPGGGDTYREARRQTVLSGIDWPTALEVSDTRVLDFLPTERF